MKKLLIEDTILAQILTEAVNSGDYKVCDRCELVVPTSKTFNRVCTDCADDLINEGLEREDQELEEAALQELLESIKLQDMLEDLADYGVPVGSVDLDIFL